MVMYRQKDTMSMSMSMPIVDLYSA